MKKILDCPICRQPSTFELSCKDADLYRCPQCDHCFSDPLSIQNSEQYGPDYFEKDWFQNENTQLFKRLGKIIGGSTPKASVIDIGCGNGAFLKFLRLNYPGLCLAGLDLAYNEPEAGLEFFRGDVFKVNISKQFDAVVSLAVIEHFSDVDAFLKRLVHLCVPGGLVVVMTMNDRSILYGTARLLKRIGFAQPCDQIYSRHHLNHFNIRSLRTLIERNGLRVTRTLFHNIPLNAVDIISPGSLLRKSILRAGVAGTFALGRLSGRTYLQTVISRKQV